MTNPTFEFKFIHSNFFGENFNQNQVRVIETPGMYCPKLGIKLCQGVKTHYKGFFWKS